MAQPKHRYPFQTQAELDGEVVLESSESDEDELDGKRIVDGIFINMLMAQKPPNGYIEGHLIIFRKLVQEAQRRKEVLPLEQAAFCEMVEMINHFEKKSYRLHSVKLRAFFIMFA